jgi:tetratricopeptide (TPR) repeat protein
MMKTSFSSTTILLVFCTVFFSSPSIAEEDPIIPAPQIGPEKKTTPSFDPILEGYKNFEQTKPRQPVIKNISPPVKAPETLKKIPSDTDSKKPVTLIQPTTSQLPTEESETFKNLDKAKPQFDSSEILFLHKKLLDTIAQTKIEEATALTEKLIQNDPQNSKGPLNKKSLETIRVFLKDLSLNEWRLKNGKLKQAAFFLRKMMKEAPLPEMKQAVKKLEIQLMKLHKLELKRNELHKDYAKGIKSLNERRWLDAISIFTKLELNDPGYPQIKEKLKEARTGNYLEEGSRLIGEARIEEAEKMYQSVLELDPENIIAKRQISVLSKKIDKEILSSQNQPHQAPKIDSPNTTDKLNKETVKLESNKNQSDPIKFSSSSRFGNILNYFYQYQDPLKPIVAGVGGTILFFLLIIRLGKLRKRLGIVKKLNANRILYENILENTPNRRALYPSLASIYRQLKMDMKLPWLIETCNERLYNANSYEAPLWQLCLGEIHQEYGNLEVALREIEQAWHMDPSREEIRQKLERLYLSLLKQDPDNLEWKSGLRRLSSPFTEQASPVQEKETEEKIVASESNKKTSPPSRQQEKDKLQPERTQEENKQTLRDILGRTTPPETAKEPLPSQNLPEQKERQIKSKSAIFSQEKKKEAYKELFGHRKKQPQKENKVEALDET